jgi:hypothetical protein
MEEINGNDDSIRVALGAALQAKLGDRPNKPPPKAGLSFAAAARKNATDETRADVDRLLERAVAKSAPVEEEEAN